MPPQLPNENTVKERYDCYDALITVTTVRNVKIKKTNKQQNNIEGNITDESRGQRKQIRKWTLKYITILTQTEQEKQIVQIHRQRNGARTAAPPYASSNFASGSLLLCSIATSTSIKKEINGPGASEWTHRGKCTAASSRLREARKEAAGPRI